MQRIETMSGAQTSRGREAPGETKTPLTAPPLYTIDNAATGERVAFLEVTPERTRILATLPPGRQNAPLHLHATFEETFEVVAGRLTIIAGDPKRPRVLAPGESAHVGLYVPHHARNETDEPVSFVVTVAPPRHYEAALRATCGLARDGRTTKDGVPRNPFELAQVALLAESYLVGVPVPLQRGLFRALAALGRWLGYRPDFPQYPRPTA